MPPVEIVSRPSSSQRALASQHRRRGRRRRTSGPSANALSYSTRAERPSLVVMIRSQPIEHDAQLSRTAARSSSASVVVSVAEVVAGQRRERVEGEQVRERAEVAVLRGGRAERARAEVLGGGEHRGGVGDRAALRGGAHGDRLEPLGAEHRAEPAAAGVAAVVRDRRVADEPLAGRPDRGDAVGGSEPRAQPLSRPRRRRGPRGRRRRLEAGAVAVDDQRRRRARRRRGRRSRRCPSACRRSRSGSRRARR